MKQHPFFELNWLRHYCQNLTGCNHYISILIWSNFGAIWLVSCSFGHYNILQTASDRLSGFMCFIQQKLECSFLPVDRKLLSAEVFWSFYNLDHSLGNFRRQYIWRYFLIFPANRIWHFMQTVSIGDNLHEMSNPVSWEKIRKLFISPNIFCGYSFDKRVSMLSWRMEKIFIWIPLLSRAMKYISHILQKQALNLETVKAHVRLQIGIAIRDFLQKVTVWSLSN